MAMTRLTIPARIADEPAGVGERDVCRVHATSLRFDGMLREKRLVVSQNA